MFARDDFLAAAFTDTLASLSFADLNAEPQGSAESTRSPQSLLTQPAEKNSAPYIVSTAPRLGVSALRRQIREILPKEVSYPRTAFGHSFAQAPAAVVAITIDNW